MYACGDRDMEYVCVGIQGRIREWSNGFALFCFNCGKIQQYNIHHSNYSIFNCTTQWY